MLDIVWNKASSTLQPAPKAEQTSLQYTVIMLRVNLTAFPISIKDQAHPLFEEKTRI